jgi:hypothetical protein
LNFVNIVLRKNIGISDEATGELILINSTRIYRRESKTIVRVREEQHWRIGYMPISSGTGFSNILINLSY